MPTKTQILIGKYLSGNSTPQENQELMEWIKKDPLHASEFEQAKKLWAVSMNLKKERNSDVDAAWNEFKVLAERTDETSKTKPALLAWKIAASVALFIVTGILVKIFFVDTTAPEPTSISILTQPTLPLQAPSTTITVTEVPDTTVIMPVANTKTKAARQRKPSITNNVSMITVSTGDSAKIFMLPDNSIVYLNAHSKLEYPDNFNKTQRRVALTGEAFFEVAKDSNQFVVSCQKTITRGAATSFNVKSHAADKEVEVIVVSGQAEFSGIGYKEFKKLVLKTGESAKLTKKTNQVEKVKHTRKNYKWWQKKSLKARIKMFFDKFKRKK